MAPTPKSPTSTEPRYIAAVGRRKRAIAQVRLYPGTGTGSIRVNERDSTSYFPLFELQKILVAPFIATGLEGKFDIQVKVLGGGMRGQAESIRLGIARALVVYNEELRTSLKKLGYLCRDARRRERKKYGHKGARRSPQWSKR